MIKVLVVALIGMLLLAACNDAEEEPEEALDTNDEAAADEPEEPVDDDAEDIEDDDREEVTIRYQSWRHADPGPVQELHGERWVERLQETHPHIQVEADAVPFGERAETALNEILAGNPPDLVALTADQVPVFAEHMLELDDFYAQEGDDFIEQFLPATLDMSQWEGSYYAIPNDLGPLEGMYYHSEVLEEAGVDPDVALSSWEDFRDALIAIDGLGTDFHGLVMLGENPNRVRHYFTWMGVNGVDMWEEEHLSNDLCSEPAMEAYSYWTGLHTDHGVVTNPIDTDWQTGHDIFVDGRAGFLMNGPWMKDIFLDADPEFDQVMGVGPIPPVEPGGDSAVTLDGLMLLIPAQAEHPEEAWEFAKVAAAADSQLELVLETGFFPVNAAAAEDPDVVGDEFLGFWSELVADYGQPILKSENSEEILQSFWENWQGALLGDIGLEESLEATCAEVETILE